MMVKFVKRGKKYFFIMDDETEYEVHDSKLTKEKKDRILFHHENVKPLKDEVNDLKDKVTDILTIVNDIKEKLET